MGVDVFLNQTTIAEDFLWDFTGTSIDEDAFGGFTSDLKRPTVIFTEPGLQTFTLTAIAEDSCASTETLEVFVFKPDASFDLGPNITCKDPILVEYIANDPNLATYTFNNDIFGDGIDIERQTSTGSTTYVAPERDEFYINRQDSITTRLIAVSYTHLTLPTIYSV